MTESHRSTEPASALRLALLAAACAAIPLTAALATSVDPTSLRNGGWVAVDERAPGNTPCNYLYVDGGNNLLYYGTSATCAARINAHFAQTRSGYEMTEAMLHFTPANQRPALLGNMVDWAVETDRGGQTLNHGGSDNCLGINQARSRQTIWYRPLPGGAVAANVEACVLARVVGYCNRQGAGTTRASWIQFRTVLQECGAG